MGLTFPHPSGRRRTRTVRTSTRLRAGFRLRRDRTVTPRPQPESLARPYSPVINRLGFNNEGVDALVRNVEAARRDRGLLGINIGKNKDRDERAAVPLTCTAYASIRWPTTSPSTSLRPTPPACANGRKKQALLVSGHVARCAGRPGGAARQACADAGEDRARPVRSQIARGRARAGRHAGWMASSPPTPTASRLSVQDHPPRGRPAACPARPDGGDGGCWSCARLRTRLPDTIPLIGAGILSRAAHVLPRIARRSATRPWRYPAGRTIRECVKPSHAESRAGG